MYSFEIDDVVSAGVAVKRVELVYLLLDVQGIGRGISLCAGNNAVVTPSWRSGPGCPCGVDLREVAAHRVRIKVVAEDNGLRCHKG